MKPTAPKPKVAVLPLTLDRVCPSLPYLALGMLSAYLKTYKDGMLTRGYEINRVLAAGYDSFPLKTVYKKVIENAPNPVCLFSSYVWNHNLNLKAAEHIKEIAPGSLIVFGGPHIPKYEGETERFLEENQFIDIAVLGEGEVALAEILSVYVDTPRRKRDLNKLAEVAGIVYRGTDGFTRTIERQRLKDINELPSPYLGGEFEPWIDGHTNAIIETNRGCPYGCTYCDWGSATLSKVAKFDPQRVIAELEYIARMKSEALFIADANFGMLEQDIEIAKALVEIKERTGYPERVYTNFAKNGGRRLMAVIEILHEGGLLPTGIIALQTTDPIVLKAIARDNIKTEAYEKMMTYFNDKNIPMASDLMIGLPEQTVDSFAHDLQFCFDWKVSAAGNFTSAMPNAPMAEKSYREQYGIVSGDDDMIQSTSSFSIADMNKMKLLYGSYQFHVRFSILKYILYFLQIDHGVSAINLLQRLIESESDLPLSARVVKDIIRDSRHSDWGALNWNDDADFLFNDPEPYYEEILGFCEREFSIEISPSERSCLKMAQQAVIPRAGREYPYRVSLEHDIVAYVNQIKAVPSVRQLGDQVKPLHEWPRGELTVTADTSVIESTFFQGTPSHSDQWELPSELRFY